MQNKEKIKNVMFRNFPGINLEDSPQGMEGSVRYWGDWQFPNEYGCEDDDDEDCDYEELTPSSRTRLAKIVGNIQKECKCDIDYDETEKKIYRIHYQRKEVDTYFYYLKNTAPFLLGALFLLFLF